MQEQNYQNHAQFVTSYHKVLIPIMLLTLIGACVNLWHSLGNHDRLYSAALIVVLVFCSIAILLFARIFALKAQDRAIRAEENLRHYVLTGKLLDPRITVKQVTALRFASDAEFVPLAAKAAQEGTKPDDLKKSIKQWRADLYRV